MHIGIDFDNTIVCYESIFKVAAVEKFDMPDTVGHTKNEVKSYFNERDEEDKWTELQGYVYGYKMQVAKPFEGFLETIDNLIKIGTKLSIVSHRSKLPYLGEKYDLHAAAKKWLLDNVNGQGFCRIDESNIFFETTLEKKIERINELACDYFIDDLPKILSHSLLNSDIKRVLFDPNNQFINNQDSKFLILNSWSQIDEDIFNA